MEKVYLGDGVYAIFDGESIILTTENGIEVTNTIVLDISVMYGFVDFLREVMESIGPAAS
jgi:hypothetical protein